MNAAWLKAKEFPADYVAKMSAKIGEQEEGRKVLFLAVCAVYESYLGNNISDVVPVDALSNVA